MTPAGISAVVGVLVSLALEYFPRFSEWYQALPDNSQKLFTLGAGALVVFGSLGLACVPSVDLPFTLAFPCSTDGFWAAVSAFLAYLTANQAAYLVLPRKSE